MGYSYVVDPINGREYLSCDVCGNWKGVRKIPCPFNWCQALAMCPTCRKERKDLISKEYHRKCGCEKNHWEFIRRERIESNLLEKGYFIRRAAASLKKGDKPMVKVLFRNKDKQEVYYWMNKETYEKFGYLIPTIPEDYLLESSGEMVKAENNNFKNE